MTSKEGLQIEELRSKAEAIEIANWHLTRYDMLRGSIANRAAVVLSANALIAAAVIILTTQYTASKLLGGSTSYAVVSSLAVLSLISVSLSVAYSAQASHNVRTWAKIFRRQQQPPLGLIYTASHTRETIKSAGDLGSLICTVTEDEYFEFAVTELWRAINTFDRRYNLLRRAIRLLLASLSLLAVDVILELTLLAAKSAQ